VGYLAAALIISAVALFVAAPLAGGFFPSRRGAPHELNRERLEHDRSLAVQGLRELEFDREMGKLSDIDYQSLRAALEQRALAAMAALENARESDAARGKGSVRRIDSARAAAAMPRSQGSRPRNINFCPQCGVRALANAKFCADCGTPLLPRERVNGRAD
jgi:hypothetical protein